VTHNPAEDFGERCRNLFDCVLVDAPCSGEGMFRKDPTARTEWSVQNVRMCAERQRKILMDVWPALKPGGILIYSTCTFNEEENEDNVQWIEDCLGAQVLPLQYQPSWGITEGYPGYHFYPHKTKSEGLYLCVLRKMEEPFAPYRIREGKKGDPNVNYENEMRRWLLKPEQWVIRQNDRFMTAYPKKYKELIEYLSTQLICISTGFGIGEERGRTVAPQHALSMAKALNKKAFPNVELDLEKALSYLRMEAISLPQSLPLGVLLLTYQGVAIGFAKNVGNRLNNLYPKEWRIRRL